MENDLGWCRVSTLNVTFLSLQSKALPGNHLGNDFHIYELTWTPTEISLFIDGINYGSLNSNLRESAIAAKIKSAVNWANNGPFNEEVSAIRANDLKIKCHQINVIYFSLRFLHQHFLSIMVSAGSVKNFFSLNSTLMNGADGEPKPWNDTGE